MKKELKKLTDTLFNGSLSRSIYDDVALVDKKAETFNSLLSIKAQSVDELKTTHISETVITPTAFASCGEKQMFDFVLIGMTPDFHDIQIRVEKQTVGTTWDQHYDFYTSYKYFNYVNQEKPSHYTNVNKLLYTLFTDHNSSNLTIESIQSQLGVEKNEIFMRLIEDKSVMFANLMPFHSKGFDTNINGINHLRTHVESYDNYISELFEMIKSYTEDHGIIMCTGYSEAKIVRMLIEEDDAQMLLENQLMSIQRWDSKLVVLFNDQLYSRHGLRSDVEISTVMNLISLLIKNNSVDIDDLKSYCEVLLNKRFEEDFKSRGKRIKGNKVQKLAVKKIRKDKPVQRTSTEK